MAVAQVDVVHFYPQENAENHHTKRYESVNQEEATTTIVRRGQPFSGVVRLKRAYEEDNDVVQFMFTLGDKPAMVTQGIMNLSREPATDIHSWRARLTDVQEDNVFFEISSPVSAPVGVWNVRIITRRKDSQDREIYDFENDLYILFNPWNCEDQTYMNESELLQEYVLNDVGKVWQGVNKKPLGRSWLFGQFDEIVLPACMFVLDRAEVPFNQRGDPVILSRAISRIVNSNDDQGVLVGRWDMEYDDGVAPTDWTGSVDILQQYLETATEVSYGQCWVFAAVVTTICRALGIPSRVVTNLVSAHDANNTLSVDKYYSEDMVPFDDDPNNPDGVDSIWSYHVWSDVWMARPDLPAGYGGWQAIDATPQETSSGFFQCGPASLQAIKQGVTGLSYDVGFMLASVNADLLRWRQNPNEESGWSIVDTNNYHIGRIIVTKKAHIFDPNGDADMDDITDQYKNREGTAAERVALMNGVRQTPRAKRYYAMLKEKPNDVSFNLLDIDTISIGEPFRIVVNVDNHSDEQRNIKAVLTANSVFYNGVKGFQVKKTEGKIRVGPRKHEQISIEVTAEEYLSKLVEYGNLKISAMAMVDETMASWADDDDIQVNKPTICIKFNDDLIINQPTATVLFFTNPLDRPLTGCQYRLSSSGIVGRTLRGTIPDVGPKGKVQMELPVQPNKLGPINFVATFRSAELSEITGAAAGDVMEG